MAKARGEIYVRGLGNCWLIERSPTLGAAFDVGNLKGSQVTDNPEILINRDEVGDVVNALESNEDVRFTTKLLQSSKTQIDYLRNARGKIYAVRYFGKVNNQASAFQYFCWENARLLSKIPIDYTVGERLLPAEFIALKQNDLSYDVPYFYFVETSGVIRIDDDLQLWIEPRIGKNSETDRLLDVSGFGRHGQLNSDFAAIWQQGSTPAEFLRFDGVNDNLNFGDILGMNAVPNPDFMVEIWVRIQAADGTNQQFISKKADTSNGAGWLLGRTSGNNPYFRVSSGAASVEHVSAGTILQNVWKHIAATFDRDGNLQVYINGAASGAPVAVGGLVIGATVASLKVGLLNTTYHQIDVGGSRVYDFGTDGLPADIATIISNHYNAERAFYNI